MNHGLGPKEGGTGVVEREDATGDAGHHLLSPRLSHVVHLSLAPALNTARCHHQVAREKRWRRVGERVGRDTNRQEPV